MSDNRSALPLGYNIGPFKIEDELGRGGFGITYRARERMTDRAVAIKEFFPQAKTARVGRTSEIRTTDAKHEQFFEKYRDKFKEEAHTLVKFRHRNIVRVSHLLEQNNTAYMVMSFEQGSSMRDWIEKLDRYPTQEELDTVVRPLLSALGTIHANNMLHRDIAPDNIFIRPNLDPVLLDFGSARPESGVDQRMTAIVKHGYSPAEQYGSDSSQQGPFTDIYALGATLYHVIAREAPPGGQERQIRALERKPDLYLPLRNSASGAYRPSFLAAVDWALELQPSRRPQSVDAWEQALFAREATTVFAPIADPSRRTAVPGKSMMAKIVDWLK